MKKSLGSWRGLAFFFGLVLCLAGPLIAQSHPFPLLRDLDPGQLLAAPETPLKSERKNESRPQAAPSGALGATVFLPIVLKHYDPSWVSPFGIVMYGQISDVAGLQKMKEAGTKWVTTFLNWSGI